MTDEEWIEFNTAIQELREINERLQKRFDELFKQEDTNNGEKTDKV